jgi:hypothetical protein
MSERPPAKIDHLNNAKEKGSALNTVKTQSSSTGL